jgi:hypothetical protein
MEKKLTEEQLTELKELNLSYTKLLTNLGEVVLVLSDLNSQVKNVEKEKEGLFSDFKTIKEKSDALYNKLSEEYGSGKIDLETGVIHPA